MITHMEKALEIHELSKTYATGVTALRGISLSVDQGDFFALLGPNGAGKSTTIGIATSLIMKSSGSLKIFGYDIETQSTQAKSHIGVVPQEFNFNMFEKVWQILVNQAGYYGVPRRQALERCDQLLNQLGIFDKRDVMARHLSGGMKRRLMIARSLIHNPKLLILDEPTAGVDIEVRRLMWSFLQQINQAGTTVILTTHYLEEAENLCRNIAIIDHGSIVANTSMKLLLKKLSVETFVINLRGAIQNPIDFGPFTVRQLDPETLEADILESQSLNQLFELLTQQQVSVQSMRNKSNRLEELFLSLTGKQLKS